MDVEEFAVKSIVQIELTNHCNWSCSYCGQMKMTRRRGFMSAVTFERCVDVLLKLGQKSVGINHYGESLMNNNLVPWIERMNEAGIVPWLYTNGDLLDDDMIQSLASVRLGHLTVSGHMPKPQRQNIVSRCVDAGINAICQIDLNDDNTLDLAGQMRDEDDISEILPLLRPQDSCGFLKNEKAVVLWDGRLVPCCFDFDAVMPFGNINDAFALECMPSVGKLCATCTGHPSNIELK